MLKVYTFMLALVLINSQPISVKGITSNSLENSNHAYEANNIGRYSYPAVEPERTFSETYNTNNYIKLASPSYPLTPQPSFYHKSHQQYSRYYPPPAHKKYSQGKFKRPRPTPVYHGFGAGLQPKQDGGILDMFTQTFSGITNMLGLGDDVQPLDGQGFGMPTNDTDSLAVLGTLAGLTAAKGLGILGFKKGALVATIFFAPLVIILSILAIFGILFIIWFIPLPVVNLSAAPANPGNPGAMGRTLNIIELADSVIQANECVERLACETAKSGKSYPPGEWFERKLRNSNNHRARRVSRSLPSMASDCSQYNCPNFNIPSQRLQRLLIPSNVPINKVQKPEN